MSSRQLFAFALCLINALLAIAVGAEDGIATTWCAAALVIAALGRREPE